MKKIKKYEISTKDYEITSEYLRLIGEKIAPVKHNCDVKVLKKVKDSFKEEKYYKKDNQMLPYHDPDFVLSCIFNYFSLCDKKLEKFKELENEIVHFRRITFNEFQKYEEIRRKIGIARNYPEREREINKKYGKIPREEYENQIIELKESLHFDLNGKKIRIKHIPNHYYHPLIVSENEKIDYINHIIKVGSGKEFINELEAYLAEHNNVFKLFDWWMFSKIDETLDDISIPFYDPKQNAIANFKPGFIFWLQKGDIYTILFIDPKGTEHTYSYRKIQGYSRIFETGKEHKRCIDFSYNGLTVNVKLLLKIKTHQKFWINTKFNGLKILKNLQKR